ncbi:hypothetical protein [Zooshikella sp. RANM57]|uniref:hypothetical protein n=1 Tax=Zooshikella sp. RANM57 TaxID=3425863 RepID=UPI003D6EFB9F
MTSSILPYIFVSTLSGYLFLVLNYKHKYRLLNSESYQVAYKALFVGFILLLISSAVTQSIYNKSFINSILENFFYLGYLKSGYTYVNYIITILFGMIFAFFINTFKCLYYILTTFHNDKCFKNWKNSWQFINKISHYEAEENDLLIHVINAVSAKQLVLLSLNSRKVYCCFLLEIRYTKQKKDNDDYALTIIPACSGYRDPDDLCVEFTTYYSSLDTPSPNQTNKYCISIPLRYIESIQNFDLRVYPEFKKLEATNRETIQKNKNKQTRFNFLSLR